MKNSLLFLALMIFLSSFSQKQHKKHSLQTKRSTDTMEVINIPVLFHVIADKSASRCYEAGANEDKNLSRDLILAELADLHRDFLLLNKDTDKVIEPYKHIIANPHINFYLDTLYNTGGEKGIIRVSGGHRKNWTRISPVVDHEKYLNVYIVNIHNSYTEDDHVWDYPEDDCIFLYYCWTGRKYRLLTHEAGHWLGLWHLWGTGGGIGDDNSCSIGDGISDTHPQKNATDGDCDHCPGDGSGEASDQSCDKLPSNYNNFMDYSGCRKMFTKEQVDSMRSKLFRCRPTMVLNSRSQQTKAKKP